jgi:hypothetical protein
MNRFLNYFLSMTMIAALLAVTSCGEDPIEEAIDAPSITLDGVAVGEESETTVDVGEEVAFNVVVNAPGRFNTLLVERTMADGTTVTDTTVSRDNTVQNNITFPFSYTPTAEEEGETVVFDFTAVDEDGRENTYTYTVMVNEQEVNTFPATLLYAPDSEGVTESFFSTENGETYSSDEVTGTSDPVSSTIDFGYFYGVNKEATLASPADFPFEVGQSGWDVRNSTMLKKTELTESSFNESTAASINAAFDNASGEGQGQATQLQVGQVVAFETDPSKEGGSRRGLIYVQDIVPGTGNNDHIEILVKVIE